MRGDIVAGSTADHHAQRPTRFRWSVLLLIFLAYTLASADRANIGIVLPLVQKQFHFSNSEMGSIVGLFFSAYAICQIPSAFLIKHFGVRNVMPLGLLFTSLMTAAHGLVGSAILLRSARVGLGIAEAPVPNSCIATINNWFPAREKGTAAGIFMASTKLGPVIVPPLGALIIVTMGWHWVFILFAIPGFVDADIDDAVVYGYAAGSTIGHEMTHGFDDQGRQFDAQGNLTDWWTKEDADKFEKRADVMVKQFDSYEPIPGLHINGHASLGENIADYGGMLIAVDAFKKTDQFKKNEKIAGYTPMQRFFLGYALSWLWETNDAMLRRSLLSDVHAPPKWRTNGPLSNMPDFWAAFDVKPGQAMRRADADRVDIW